MNKSREYTKEEVREQFLEHVRYTIDYWDSQPKTKKECLSGLAFSILAMLDGCCGDLPGFIVAPLAHKTDKAYHQANGGNWYPENHDVVVKANIAGGLHDLLGR